MKSGERVNLSAEGSTDPDGDALVLRVVLLRRAGHAPAVQRPHRRAAQDRRCDTGARLVHRAQGDQARNDAHHPRRDRPWHAAAHALPARHRHRFSLNRGSGIGIGLQWGIFRVPDPRSLIPEPRSRGALFDREARQDELCALQGHLVLSAKNAWMLGGDCGNEAGNSSSNKRIHASENFRRKVGGRS